MPLRLRAHASILGFIVVLTFSVQATFRERYSQERQKIVRRCDYVVLGTSRDSGPVISFLLAK